MAGGHEAWELRGALEALDRIAELVAEGNRPFIGSADRQMALVFCWVNVGSLLKQFMRRTGLAATGDALSAPIKMRDKLVYSNLSDLRMDVIWQTCLTDGPTLREFIRSLYEATKVVE